MFSSAGYFRDVICPYFASGLCDRPYCHFKHARIIDDKANHEAVGSETEENKPAQSMLSMVGQAIRQVQREIVQPTSLAHVVDTALVVKAPVQKLPLEYNPTPIHILKQQSKYQVTKQIINADEYDPADNYTCVVRRRKRTKSHSDSIAKKTKHDVDDIASEDQKDDTDEDDLGIFSDNEDNVETEDQMDELKPKERKTIEVVEAESWPNKEINIAQVLGIGLTGKIVKDKDKNESHKHSSNKSSSGKHHNLGKSSSSTKSSSKHDHKSSSSNRTSSKSDKLIVERKLTEKSRKSSDRSKEEGLTVNEIVNDVIDSQSDSEGEEIANVNKKAIRDDDFSSESQTSVLNVAPKKKKVPTATLR